MQSIFPTLFRRRRSPGYTRERIETPDGDFLDLDWARVGARRLAILSHGLEGNSRSSYVLGMSRALIAQGWDVLAWNYRGCSGEPNRRLRSYHSGATDDLETVVHHAAQRDYQAIALIGFSLGGNMTLLYLGRYAERAHPRIKAAAVFSVPCDLAGSAGVLARPVNRVYMKYFLDKLHGKIRAKMQRMPGRVHDNGFHRIRTFQEFDDRYTAPIHGFRDAADYWKQCSSKPVIPGIRIPVLMVQAKNDPFLSPSCFPEREAAGNPNFSLIMPASGGHVGFIAFNSQGRYWSEAQAAAFLKPHASE